ncbi:WhiB family transcriptional regulator [Rhodococcus aetherivorans]|uniref:WhiB family transcriptional regulator n=1 Tax=Rhodococcus aetherivorans TaxID=191292 RepID=UPI0026EA6563|nr:WhiB family transcriptional regulator [Rhodococcus aetherivorans]WKW97318.1 WhiB family transcriptional regulator [Rhodococcus aetherivorans]
MTAPSPEQVAETIADLDALAVPVEAGRPAAERALRAAGRGVSTDRLRVALTARRERAGLPSRRPAAAAPPTARRKTGLDLIAGLVDPRLTGARCAGRAPMFDAEVPGESAEDRAARLAAAAAICRGCPVVGPCRTAALEQDHPAGMWAGRLRDHAATPGRSRKDLSA